MFQQDDAVGEIRQIIVITDGKSNIGVNPIDAARLAAKLGIVVSTIGIINQDNQGDERDIEELEGIAKAGGGICEYTHLENLGLTVQAVTQKTAQRTLEQIVSKQLKSIIGVEMNSLEPKSRFKIVDFIENFGDSINLKCAIVLDTSGSMGCKLNTAKDCLTDLLQNLQSRRGESKIAVIKYPGFMNETASLVSSFTDSTELLRSRLNALSAGGGTPTGPAIEMACHLILEGKEENKNGDVQSSTKMIESYYV